MLRLRCYKNQHLEFSNFPLQVSEATADSLGRLLQMLRCAHFDMKGGELTFVADASQVGPDSKSRR
jgi:hypothetical protein